MQTFRFTKKAIERLPVPDKLTTYHDTNTNALKLVVRPSGTKTYILYRKIKGKPERITLGRFPDLSIEQARNKASALNVQIAQGQNPSEKQRITKQEMTLDELFQQYLEQHAKLHNKAWQYNHDQYQRHLVKWRNYKLSQITNTDIRRLHATLGCNNGHHTANRILELLHAMFNKAIEWGWEKANPAHGIKKFREKSRERFIQADELPRFFQALMAEPNETARDYILLSLLTGARKSNVLAMRWEEINFKQATWTIPETKNGDAHTVPLVDVALAILQLRYNKNNQCVWVFPGSGKTGHLVEPKKAWKRILAAANIKDLRLHDLRRSLGSWQANTGASLPIIGKTLAHKNIATTAIYARLNIDPVREAMDKATQAMLQAAQTDSESSFTALLSKLDNNTDQANFGYSKGHKEGIAEVAKKLLAKGHETAFITEVTTLSIAEIENIKQGN